jgi:hypothetical protein
LRDGNLRGGQRIKTGNLMRGIANRDISKRLSGGEYPETPGVQNNGRAERSRMKNQRGHAVKEVQS